MATLAHSAPPIQRRVTRLFTDNKKSYEALVQTGRSGPQLSHLHLKLRIQKDRLIAWGIQWSDRSAAAYPDDIDGSLDRAGISDLVASIMCSIRELLDEAEILQPQSHDVALLSPSSKARLVSADGAKMRDGEWSGENLRRLEEILNDLTTSIDTLCDLSRPKIGLSSPSSSQSKGVKRRTLTHGTLGESSPIPASPLSSQTVSSLKSPQVLRDQSPSQRDDLTSMAYIDPSLLRFGGTPSKRSSSPPSYESIAANSENRVLAFFSLPSLRSPSQSSSEPTNESPILLDFQKSSFIGPGSNRPENGRFEELLLTLLKFSTWRANVYTGIMKLTGWTVDVEKPGYAYAYEVPRMTSDTSSPVDRVQPRSLLSFLQNGGDADSSNIPPLENRYRLALNAALSILHLHEMNVTHRHINSNNLLFFLDKDLLASQDKVWKGQIIRRPYLTGFHQRGSGAFSFVSSESFSRFYYHPRLESDPGVQYEVTHDYYSLGLILLEIGLWMPIGKFWKARYSLADFKIRLQDIYLKKLAAKVGTAYANAVLFCLTAADEIERGIQMGVSLTAEEHKKATGFHYNVIAPLERCCRIEEENESDLAAPAVPEQPELPTQIDAKSITQPTQPSTTENSLTHTESVKESLNEPITNRLSANVSSLKATKENIKASQRIKVWSHELPALYTSYWTSTMFPKLQRILKKAISRWESYTIDLFMAGDHPDTARPTVYMECTSTAKVKRILRHLNKELRLFEIKVVSGQVVRSKSGNKRKKTTKKKGGQPKTGTSKDKQPMKIDLNPHYQPEPACGASIGAYRNGSHLPPVTFGGAVLVDGEPFGMSVHHMLEDEDEIQLALNDVVSLHRSMAPQGPPRSVPDGLLGLGEHFANFQPFEEPENPGDDVSSASYAFSDYSSQGTSASPSCEALYPFEISDEEIEAVEELDDDPANDFWLSPNFDTASTASESEDFDLGDTDGIPPSCGSSLIVTQPALDDVQPDFFPTEEDINSDHLSSHALGHIHASSGLRRSRSDSLVHEVDWALIKIDPNRLPSPPFNRPSLSGSGGDEHRLPTSIVPSSTLGSRNVHSHARSSGLFARGTILPTMRLVRMPGRTSPSHSWQVRGSFGAGGDSGAWVFDDKTGAVCGHVLAFSEKSSVAYIAPMDIMVEDMERVLGGKVCLPDGPSAEAMATGAKSYQPPQAQLVKRSTEVEEDDEGVALELRRSLSPAFPTSPPVSLRELPPSEGKKGDNFGHESGIKEPLIAA